MVILNAILMAGPEVPLAGFCGVINPASPRDACQPFWIHPVLAEGRDSFKHIALIERGNCNFEVKVRHAQMAGYGATVLFNNDKYGDAEGLVTSKLHLSYLVCSFDDVCILNLL